MRPTTALATIVAVGCFAGDAIAQAPATTYVHLAYMRVQPGAESAYLDLEREVWRPIHEEQRRQGDLTNWTLYTVAYAPFDTPYDYVTATVFRDLAYLEGEGWEGAFRSVHPEADYIAAIARTMRMREIVHTEVWALVESVSAGADTAPTGRYLAVNFMDVSADGSAEYLATEREVWAPIHGVRATDGGMNGWNLYSIVFPRGETMNYRFGTVDFFDSLNAAADGTTGAQMRRAHPEASQDEIDAMMERTDAAREIYKTEVWRRVETLNSVEG